MKPENYHKDKSKRRADARVKMHLRHHLKWLWGYPLDHPKDKETEAQMSYQWRVLYFPAPWEVQTVPLGSHLLSSTQYNRNKLIRDFPHALPRIVGNMHAWSEHIALKIKAVHDLLDGQSIDPWQRLIAPHAPQRLLHYAKQLKQRHPELQPLIHQFGWWLSADSEALSQALSWFDQHAHSLKNILKNTDCSHDLLPKLFFLSQQVGDKRCYSLLLILQHPAWKVARPEIFPVRKLHKDHIVQPEVGHDYTKSLQNWLDEVLLLPKRAKKHQLDALSTLFPEITISRLGERWRLIDDLPALLHAQQKQLTKHWHELLDVENYYEQELGAQLKQIKGISSASFYIYKLPRMLHWFTQYPQALAGLKRFISAINADKHDTSSLWRHPDLALYIACTWYETYQKYSDLNIKKWLKFLPKMVAFVEADHDLQKQQKRLAMLTDLFNPAKYKSIQILDELYLALP